MITKIKINNFKSLFNFSLSDLSQFTCLIGVNGAGKTTLLQFLDFVSALRADRVREWFERSKWNPVDIISFGASKHCIDFEIEMEGENQDTATWKVCYDLKNLRCKEESFSVKQKDTNQIETIASFSEDKMVVDKNTFVLPPDFVITGSIFSRLPQSHFLADSSMFKIFNLLDPAAIAQATQTGTKAKVEVQPNGAGLVGFLSQLTEAQQNDLFLKIHDFYPDIIGHKIRKQHFGWKNLLLKEYGNAFFDASHLSYGTLRLLVILSQLYFTKNNLLFDEIENGINQELFEKLLSALQYPKDKQIIVSTHSALFLNYLTDVTAQKSVIFMYKDSEGHTHAQKFFDIEGMKDKLQLLGPGEVMADTNLEALSQKLAEKLEKESK